MPWVLALMTPSLYSSILATSTETPLAAIPILAKCRFRLVDHLRGMQQRLRGDAADIEAGAAQGATALDTSHLQAKLSRTDGADIAPRAATNYNNIIVGHMVSPSESVSSLCV